MKLSARMMLCLLTSGVLWTGCSNNSPALNAANKLPPDPAVDRSDIETLTKNSKGAKTAAAPPAANPMPTASELGLAIYPDAKPFTDSTGVINPMATDGMKMAMLESKDSVEKVVAFYQQELPNATVTKDTEEGQPIVRLSETTGKSGVKAVSVTIKEGKTQIILTNVEEMPNLKADTPASSATPEAGNQPPR